MNLNETKLNADAVVSEIDISDEKIKFRLMELGLNIGTRVRVKNRSMTKKTLLIIFNASCFTIKDEVAKGIKVVYA